VTLAASPSTIGASGGTGQVTVGVSRECTWDARAEADWIALTPTHGQGEATVGYTASANPLVTSRRGAIVVNDQRIEIEQAARSCSFAVSGSADPFAAEGGTRTATVTTQPSCAWTAASQSSWISIVSGSAGSGNGRVTVRVDPNSGASRRGTVVIAGHTITVTQNAAQTPGPQTSDPGRTIRLEGTISRLSGTCPNLTFALQGRLVRTNGSTDGLGQCRLTNGDEVRVDGVVQPDGSVLATRVREEDD
jgi:ribosome-associated protein YbcJ (S4-like RNA binding protein)